MIWIKRLIPFVLLIAGVIAYSIWQEHEELKYSEQAQRHALATARVWFASVHLRKNPDVYRAYRDSVLSECGLSSAQVKAYMKQYEEKPELYEEFTRLVNFYTDSLNQVREGYQINFRKETDTTDGQ